jgi:hypothetical protein
MTAQGGGASCNAADAGGLAAAAECLGRVAARYGAARLRQQADREGVGRIDKVSDVLGYSLVGIVCSLTDECGTIEAAILGVPKFNAAVAAGSPTGFWRMSGHPAVQQALRNHYFDSLGLPRLHVSAHA